MTYVQVMSSYGNIFCVTGPLCGEFTGFTFSYFFWWRPFWKCPRRGSAFQNFPVNITDSYSLGCKLAEKYKFVYLWEGCMMSLPRLQSTKLCMHNTPRPVTRSLDVFFDQHLNKGFSKQSRHQWYEMPSRSLWHHCNNILFVKLKKWVRFKTLDNWNAQLNCTKICWI